MGIGLKPNKGKKSPHSYLTPDTQELLEARVTQYIRLVDRFASMALLSVRNRTIKEAAVTTKRRSQGNHGARTHTRSLIARGVPLKSVRHPDQ